MIPSKKQYWHIEPDRGLLNDPNGLSWFHGLYYAFFQWNRFEKNHSHKEWGYCTSPDLTHWTFHGSALLPDQSYDAQGVYSGSALVIDDALHLFYTGNVKQDGQRRSSQCLAISTDGQHFLKTGPMFTTPDGYTEHFRDPKVFHAGGTYWMVIGAQQRTGKGAIVLFSSSDAQHWNLVGPLAQSEACQMIECPDLFLIDDTAVLLYCPQWRDNARDLALHSFAAYKLTHFDTAAGTLGDRNLDDNRHLLDQGFDFYAPQTLQTPDGRRVILGWMSRMEDAQEAVFCQDEPRIHCLTMPRELFIKDGKLCQRPVRELSALLGAAVAPERSDSGLRFAPSHRYFRLMLEAPTGCSDLELSFGDGEWRFIYDAQQKVGTLTRRSWVQDREETRSFALETCTALELWSDQSSIELFVNGGAHVLSARVFPTASQPDLRISGIDARTTVQVNELCMNEN